MDFPLKSRLPLNLHVSASLRFKVVSRKIKEQTHNQTSPDLSEILEASHAKRKKIITPKAERLSPMSASGTNGTYC